MAATEKVLLVSPVWQSLMVFGRPHLGLGLLAARLRDAGYDVAVADYILDRATPPLKRLLRELSPDIVGITTTTSLWRATRDMLDMLKQRPDIRVIVGGPHATLYTSEYEGDEGIDLIFLGEADDTLVPALSERSHGRGARTVPGLLADLRQLPFPAFDRCINVRSLVEYPVQTSRGCPFGCIFCTVSRVSSRQWRGRDLEACYEELDAAVARFPALKVFELVDDNPGGKNLSRFKAFLAEYARRWKHKELRIDNIRADAIDAEVATLLKETGCGQIGLGVEHADPEVFRGINKGESLEQIREAASLLKAAGMRLGMCFVMGLPGDSFEKTKASVRFAREYGADYMFWNVLVPHKGTRVREWMERHGDLYDEREFVTRTDNQILCDTPPFETPTFSRRDILRAHFWAVLATDNYRLTKKVFFYVILTALRYGFIKELLLSLISQFKRRLKRRLAAGKKRFF
ncbi:MAG: radical SAM protein [bacterium]